MEIRIPIENTPEGYEKFLQCKNLARYTVEGREIVTDELSHALLFGGAIKKPEIYDSPHLLDFQEMIVNTAIERHRFAAFLDCGLGKTPIKLAWAHTLASIGKVLIICPLSVLNQLQEECLRWYGHKMANLRKGEPWNDGIAVVNFEGRRSINMDGVVGVALDESSILKNDTGETRNWLVDLVKNVSYRLCASATPAPNDYSEYASHAVFLGLVKTAKEFYARYFRKEGVNWILKPHAYAPFYKNLASWAIYIQSPKKLGFDCMTEMPTEPNYIYEKCDTPPNCVVGKAGLVASAENSIDRPMIFGELRSDPKSDRTKKCLDAIDGKKSIIWCSRNNEETMFSKLTGKDSMVVNGSMDVEKRVETIDAWKAGEFAHLISKPSVLGFGVNLPQADVNVYSGYTYSFETFYQAVRRSHRYGRIGTLDVLVPYTYPELHILNTVRRKVATFQQDVELVQNMFAKQRTLK